MKTVREAYQALTYGEPIHYIVLTFWLFFRWRKFKMYMGKLEIGMGWRSAFNDTWRSK